MKIHKFKTKDQWLNLRLQDVTSTEVSALFGLSPYMTEFELWHRKKNKEIVILEDNERMTWGTRLEQAIAEGIADDNSWLVHPFKDYARHDTIRAGSSFDYMVAIPNEAGDSMIEGLLEIKNVDSLQFRNKWIIEDGKVIEAPPHIELQCQHQLMITGYPFLYLGALVGGNSVTIIKRTPDEKIISAMKSKIIKFWNSIEHNIEPSPDFIKDAEYISEIYGYAEPGKVIDGTDEIEKLVVKYTEAAAMAKASDQIKMAAKAELLTKIGDAEKVYSDKYTISAGVTGPVQMNYERKGFRNFRVYLKKEKPNGKG